MAYEVRGLKVLSGSSTEVHRFLDRAGSSVSAEFNTSAGPGAFGVSGSANIGRTDQNHLTDGGLINGLLEIPTYNASDDAAQLETLAGSGLDNGTYNGCLFHLEGVDGLGYNGSNARALSLFARPDCLYFCRNGNWYHGGFYTPASSTTSGPAFFQEFMDAQVLEQFEQAGSWGHTLSISDLDDFSNFSSTTNDDALTFENANGFFDTYPSFTFSNFGTLTNSDTLDSVFANSPDLESFSNFGDGHTTSFAETFEHGNGFTGTHTSTEPTPNWDSSPDGSFTETFEHSNGFTGTHTTTEPNPDWDSSPDGSFTEGFDDW